jgi:rod shape-determining protein MreC
LIFISTLLIVNNNEYQRSKYLSLENEIVGKIYAITNNISSYVGLRSTNEELMRYIATLESRVQFIESQLKEVELRNDSTLFLPDSVGLPYDFIPARIINKNITGVENFITLNKGSRHGVKADMGVLGTSSYGVVGIVLSANANFSTVIPVLNPKFKLSCKIKNSAYSGPLVWDHQDIRYAILEELPRHVEANPGDTVVTSGYSAIFPEGIAIGTVESSKKEKNDNFNSVKIKLFINLGDINHVLIVKNNYRDEQLNLEKRNGNVN